MIDNNIKLLAKINSKLKNTSKFSEMYAKLLDKDKEKTDEFFNDFSSVFAHLSKENYSRLFNQYEDAFCEIYEVTGSIGTTIERLDFSNINSDKNGYYYSAISIKDYIPNIDRLLRNKRAYSTIYITFKGNIRLPILSLAVTLTIQRFPLYNIKISKGKYISGLNVYKIIPYNTDLKTSSSNIAFINNVLSLRYNNKLLDHKSSIYFLNTILATYYKLLGVFHDRFNNNIARIKDNNSIDEYKPLTNDVDNLKYLSKYNKTYKYVVDDKNEILEKLNNISKIIDSTNNYQFIKSTYIKDYKKESLILLDYDVLMPDELIKYIDSIYITYNIKETYVSLLTFNNKTYVSSNIDLGSKAI